MQNCFSKTWNFKVKKQTFTQLYDNVKAFKVDLFFYNLSSLYLSNWDFYPLKLLLPIVQVRVTLMVSMRPSGWYEFETQNKCFLFVFNHIVYYRHRSQRIAMFIASCGLRKSKESKAIRQYIADSLLCYEYCIRWKRTNSNGFEINVLSTPNVGGGGKIYYRPGRQKVTLRHWCVAKVVTFSKCRFNCIR